MKEPEILKSQLEAWMARRGLKPPGLAQRAGVSYRTLNNMLNPSRGIAPTLGNIAALASALNCTVGDLLSPLPPDEAQMLAEYRAASAGRREGARALLRAPQEVEQPKPLQGPAESQTRYQPAPRRKRRRGWPFPRQGQQRSSNGERNDPED